MESPAQPTTDMSQKGLDSEENVASRSDSNAPPKPCTTSHRRRRTTTARQNPERWMEVQSATYGRIAMSQALDSAPPS